MGWQQRGLIQVWDGSDFGDVDDPAYRWSAVPIEERPHPASCGRPGTGRNVHRANDEPTCEVCRNAEAAYAAWRREAKAC